MAIKRNYADTQGIPYHITESKRKNSKIFVSNGFRYYKKKESLNQISLLCQLRQNWGCGATAKVDKTHFLLFVLIPHNHSIDEYNEGVQNLKKRLKEAASSEPGSSREIFNRVCRDDPEAAAQISYTQVCRTMHNRRLENYPRIPNSCDEFEHLLSEHTGLRINYKCHVSSTHDKRAFIFFSDEMIRRFAQIREICYDGTFYIVPKLFIISIRIQNWFVKPFFILMTKIFKN